MMNNDIYILRELKSLAYPNPQRICTEIIDFTKNDTLKIKKVLNRLIKGEPWEYIKGSSEFRGLIFRVNKNVLIPRIETEQIIDIVKESISNDILNIIDLGTGSGAIAVTIKKEIPKVSVMGIDISENALNIARDNAQQHGLDIKFIVNNLLEGIDISSPTLIVANLPYIPHDDYLKLDRSVKDFEPEIALDGGEYGTKYIEAVINEFKRNANIKKLILEIDQRNVDRLNSVIKGISHKYIKDVFGLIRFLKLYR